ncbi:MAG: BolA family transcriptional regulator [Rhodospirillales bacterium]|nr:BolA family transcriptional regulator [Rhodospirillales bacterium]
MTIAETIRIRLEDAFSPNVLEVIDESHLHSGHAGARPEGETHFRVTVVSETFKGENRVERQRSVYRVLSDLLEGPIHALSLKLSAPDES